MFGLVESSALPSLVVGDFPTTSGSTLTQCELNPILAHAGGALLYTSRASHDFMATEPSAEEVDRRWIPARGLAALLSALLFHRAPYVSPPRRSERCTRLLPHSTASTRHRMPAVDARPPALHFPRPAPPHSS